MNRARCGQIAVFICMCLKPANAMKNQVYTRLLLAALFGVLGLNSPLAHAADSTGIVPSVPVISIRAAVPETREPFCDPDVCDAALPAPGVFVVSRRGGNLESELSVLLSYEGTAINGTDYAELPIFITFRPGAESVELLVEGAYDQLPEGDEAVVARLQPDPSLGPIERYRLDPAQNIARVVIHDNEAAELSVVSIEATSEIAEETSYPYRRLAFRGRFTISRTGPTNNPLPVFVHYSGTATPGVDFPALPWLVSIPAGATSVELEVVPNVDNIAEPIEILEAQLAQCPPETHPPLGIPCYLVNIDPIHSSARVFLRDDGITTASLELTAPKDGAEFAAGQPIRIAATAIDLEGAMTHVEFFDGEDKVGESLIFFIRPPDPGTPIQHEFEWNGATAGKHELTARAVNAAGEKIVSAPVQITVTDGLPVVSIEATVPETTEPSPTSRIRPGVFTLRRTGDASEPLRVWVHYAGSATPESDYAALPNVVEFPAGTASVELLVVPVDDGLAEGDETVVAELTHSPLAVAPGYAIDPENRRAVVTIHDNGLSAIPIVSIRATQPNTAEACPVCLVAPGVFTISRTGGTEEPLHVLYRLGGTAKNGEDYERLSGQAVIPAGRESVEVLVLGILDDLMEGDETVVAQLYVPEVVIAIFPPPPPPYHVNPEHAAATVIIHDHPPTPQSVVSIVATDPFAREGTTASGEANTAAFTVTRTGGTAMSGEDYEALESPLVIPAGQRRARLVVRPIDDHRAEPIETVLVTLAGDDALLASYTVGFPRRAAAILVDNDHPRPFCVRLPGGWFNFCLPVESGDCFRVEATRDFKEWTLLAIVPVNEGRVHYVDPDAPELAHRFYRFIPVPCEP